MAAAAATVTAMIANTTIHAPFDVTAMKVNIEMMTRRAHGNFGSVMVPAYVSRTHGRLAAVTAASAWIQGARPRTLPAAVAPVVAGTGAAALEHGVVWWKAAAALGVSLALQVGVNYANDYSDGIRGTDDDRVGPLRLVGSRLASPAAVKRAAVSALVVGAALGCLLAATTSWWLLLIGAAALGAAWTYTGGSNPYGYRGLGEVSVFVFFGLVAVVGTTFVQLERATWPSVVAGMIIGALACAILVANNLRDVHTDTTSGKRTLAVRLGETRTRRLYLGLGLAAWVGVATCGLATPWALAGLIGLVPWLPAARAVRDGAAGLALIPVLQQTGVAELLASIGLAVGFAVGA
jgi:1,4-dihydroxy-2-naphthoate octaprenyltransferase